MQIQDNRTLVHGFVYEEGPHLVISANQNSEAQNNGKILSFQLIKMANFKYEKLYEELVFYIAICTVVCTCKRN